MSSPKIKSVAELEAQLALNRGWLILYIHALADENEEERSTEDRSTPCDRDRDPSVQAFETARNELEDRYPVTLLHCVLPPSALRCSPWADLDPMIWAFYRGNAVESLKAPESPLAVIEWVEMLDSFHTPESPSEP